jgi:hypothetical protein
VYQLCIEAGIQSGHPFVRISREAMGGDHLENYIDPLTRERMQVLQAQVGEQFTVVKTHAALDESAAKLLTAGNAKAVISFRDPRDIALSLVDHGRRSRALGIADFAEFERPTQTIPLLLQQIGLFERWRSAPNVLVLEYEEIAFDTSRAVEKITKHLGFDVDSTKLLKAFDDKKSILQFNKGEKRRYQRELRSDELAEFDHHLSWFIQRYWKHF